MLISSAFDQVYVQTKQDNAYATWHTLYVVTAAVHILDLQSGFIRWLFEDKGLLSKFKYTSNSLEYLYVNKTTYETTVSVPGGLFNWRNPKNGKNPNA